MQTIQRPDSERHEPEAHFSIMHAIGIVLLLAILEALISLMLSLSKAPMLDTSGWVNISITKVVSGLLTAQAGAILAGVSLVAILTAFNIQTKAIMPLVAGVFGISILSSEFSNVLQWIEPLDKAYIEAFEKLFQQNRIGVFLTIGIVAPIFEELVFRWIILEALRDRYRISTAIFVSTLLFGVVHIFPWVVLNAFLLGLFFAWLKLETNSLPLCIIAHSLYNSLPFLFADMLPMDIPGYTALPAGAVQFQPWWFDLLGALLLFVGVTGVSAAYRTNKEGAGPFEQNSQSSE